MKEKFLKYFKKLNNTGSIISIVSLIIVILTVNHISVDSERIMDTVKAICSILVILGILNNPTTTGLDLPGK
ncbi:MAG: phage holin [Sarcina sp.]